MWASFFLQGSFNLIYFDRNWFLIYKDFCKPGVIQSLVSQRLVQCKRMQVYFNAFFASQCTPNSNDSALPDVTNHISNVSLSSIQFEDQDILNIICSLNYNKAHGYDDISIRF